MELEDWLYYEDPVEKLAEYDMPDYLPENLARELHEVYATHRENRARLAKAVKARGYYVTKGKGKKGAGKSRGKDGGKSAGKAPPKSKGKGGKARGMSLEELKKVTVATVLSWATGKVIRNAKDPRRHMRPSMLSRPKLNKNMAMTTRSTTRRAMAMMTLGNGMRRSMRPG
jgi:hypothetical protein